MNAAPGLRSARRVVVVGAINVDFVVKADRLPTAGETVVGPGLQRYGGGKGANAAVAAARAGASVSLVGAVGTDDQAAFALEELRDAGVALDGVARLERDATGAALIVVDRDGENQIAVGAGANAVLNAEWVRREVERLLPDAGCVLVSTEIPGDAVSAAVQTATDAGVICVLNTAPPIPAVLGLLEHGPLLTPNATELAALSNMLDEGEPRSAPEGLGEGDRNRLIPGRARRLMRGTGAPVVVTLGGAGAEILTPSGRAECVPALSVEVRDTTGAGDTFNGVLAARLAAGNGLAEAVRVAVAAASLSVAHPGARAGMPRAAELDTALGRARLPTTHRAPVPETATTGREDE